MFTHLYVHVTCVCIPCWRWFAMPHSLCTWFITCMHLFTHVMRMHMYVYMHIFVPIYTHKCTSKKMSEFWSSLRKHHVLHGFVCNCIPTWRRGFYCTLTLLCVCMWLQTAASRDVKLSKDTLVSIFCTHLCECVYMYTYTSYIHTYK